MHKILSVSTRVMNSSFSSLYKKNIERILFDSTSTSFKNFCIIFFNKKHYIFEQSNFSDIGKKIFFSRVCTRTSNGETGALKDGVRAVRDTTKDAANEPARTDKKVFNFRPYTEHAELRALKKAHNRRIDVTDSFLFSVRVCKDSCKNELIYGDSAPCINCYNTLKRFGVKNVFFTRKENAQSFHKIIMGMDGEAVCIRCVCVINDISPLKRGGVVVPAEVAIIELKYSKGDKDMLRNLV